MVGLARAAAGRRLILGVERRGIGASTVTLNVQQLEGGTPSPCRFCFEVVYSEAVKASTM